MQLSNCTYTRAFLVLEEEDNAVTLKSYIVIVKLSYFFYSVNYSDFHLNPFMDGQALGFFFKLFDCVNFFVGILGLS